MAFPIDKLFAELKLPALVPMRSNGLTAMVRRIQAVAEHCLQNRKVTANGLLRRAGGRSLAVAHRSTNCPLAGNSGLLFFQQLPMIAGGPFILRPRCQRNERQHVPAAVDVTDYLGFFGDA